MQIIAVNRGDFVELIPESPHVLADWQALEDKLKYLLGHDVKRIAINLKMHRQISSAGIGCLLSCQKLVDRYGDSLILLNVQDPLRDMLELLEFDHVFTIE